MAVRAETMPATVQEEGITRFDVHQRVQHILMTVSFTLLAVTGLPQKFHDWSLSQWWIAVLGGIDNARSIHHFAAAVMVLCCVYHLVHIGYNVFIRKRGFPYQIFPRRKDFTDFFKDVLYFLRIRKTGARYDRFNYLQKFDYWAIFWGMPIMAISGFILWFPVLATKYLPGWIVPVSLVAHSDEAILAVAWVFIVHIFFSVFPWNPSIWTGKLSRGRYREEHPLEYERLFETTEETEEEEKED